MKLPMLDYICPATLSDAIAALSAHGGDAKVIAGGQSLMPMLISIDQPSADYRYRAAARSQSNRGVGRGYRSRCARDVA